MSPIGLLGWKKENIECNWAGACCSLNSVWHWPSDFLLLASCLGSAKYRPSTCSLCKVHDVLYLYTATWAWVLTVPTPVKGILDRTQQKTVQNIFFGFTGTLRVLQYSFSFAYSICQFSLYWPTSLGLKRISKIWSVTAKGKGVSFLTMQGLTTDKSTSLSRRSIRGSLGCTPSAS